jgi:hypothetical protein
MDPGSALAVLACPGRHRGCGMVMASRSRDMICPRFTFRCPSKTEEQGTPGARCTRGLVCKMHKEKRTRAYRFGGGNPAFPARLSYGLCRALPGERIRLVTVAAGLRLIGSGWIVTATDSLAPATGVGTTRFCRTQSAFAKASADKPVENFWHRRKQRRSSARWRFAHGRTALRTTLRANAAASTASHPASVTTRDPPLLPGWDGASW